MICHKVACKCPQGITRVALATLSELGFKPLPELHERDYGRGVGAVKVPGRETGANPLLKRQKSEFVRRKNVEEEALSRALGERYREYMKRTKRLAPFIY